MKTPIQQAKELQSELKKDTTNTEAMLRLTEFMAAYDGDDRVIPSTELDEEIKLFEEEERYYTGIKKLDNILDGFRSNQVVAVSAPTKAGKTQFCIHIARNLPNPTMFLFEETAAEVLYKYKKKGVELPLFYTTRDITNSDDMEWIYSKMIESWAKYNSKIFFIDHLHYLLDNSNENTTYKIKRVMQELKQFAKRHNFTIFLVAHIKHMAPTEPPGVEDIRDSSFVAQYADTTLMLWRQTLNSGAKEHKKLYTYTTNLLINVALNRKINFEAEENTGLVDLTFNTDTWSYEETDWYTEWLLEDEVESKNSDSLMSKLYGNN